MFPLVRTPSSFPPHRLCRTWGEAQLRDFRQWSITSFLILALGLVVFSPAALARPVAWQTLDELALDDPHAAVAHADRQVPLAAQAGDREAELWWLLGAARVLDALEESGQQAERLLAAQALLLRWPGAGTLHRLWLAQAQSLHDLRDAPAREMTARILALRQQASALQDADLACELMALELWVLLGQASHDEAWAAGESVERCAIATGNLDLEVSAVLQLGSLTGLVSRNVAAAGQGERYFKRALDRLGNRPARFMRSLIEWDLGNALAAARNEAKAAEHYQRALSLSRDLNDEAGIAAAVVKVGELALRKGDASAALRAAEEGQRLMEAQRNEQRLLSARILRLRALTALKRPELASAIAAGRELDTPAQSPARRVELAVAVAEAHASAGQYALAYAELKRSEHLREEGQDGQRDALMMRLQASYEVARREAENTELRRRSETAQLALVAEAAGQRSLWAALLALSLVLAVGGVWAWRGWHKRQQLAELALRDELTGLPNRRAIRAGAQTQLIQARQWQLPLALAVIDLDHFKQVNDRHGHPVGDAALRAFAQAAGGVLRSQDRLGRVGGEEFLLLMPGTLVQELPAVFARLRSAFAACDIEGLASPHGLRFSMGGIDAGAEASLDELIAAADEALYKAKHRGRDRLVLAGADSDEAGPGSGPGVELQWRGA